MPLRNGLQNRQVLFGSIQDCGPDRWGRILVERAVRKQVFEQKPYREIDYVLALDDATRLGALRFRPDSSSPFLAVSIGQLPPLIRLQALLHATDAIQSETDTAADLRFLLGAGSPLGGARPKSAVSLTDGIRQFGHDVAGDLCELWRRLLFSLLVSNDDDHLRNHGFLMLATGRWSLSPAYDLNPVSEIDRVRTNKTPISERHQEPSVDEVLTVATRFGIKAPTAITILREVFTAVSAWRRIGRSLGLKAATLVAYASAFEHELMAEARRLLAK